MKIKGKIHVRLYDYEYTYEIKRIYERKYELTIVTSKRLLRNNLLIEKRSCTGNIEKMILNKQKVCLPDKCCKSLVVELFIELCVTAARLLAAGLHVTQFTS